MPPAGAPSSKLIQRAGIEDRGALSAVLAHLPRIRWGVILASLFALLVSRLVFEVEIALGLSGALIQALTQLQEPTLTFVPKILAIFGTLIITMPFMISTMVSFMEQLAQRNAGLQ